MRYLFSQHHRWSHTLGLGLTWNWHYTRRKGEVCRFGGYNSSQTQCFTINALPGTYHPKNTFMQFTHTTSFYWKGLRLKCWKIPFVEDTEWFGVIFELPDVLVVEYQVISSSLLKGLWQGSADGLDVCEKYLVVSILHLMINLSSAVYRQRYAFSLLDRLSGGATLYGVDFKNYEFDLWPR